MRILCRYYKILYMTPPRLKFKTLSFINMILGSHEYTNQKKRKEIIFQANVNLLFNSTDQKLHTYFVYSTNF